MIIQRARNFPIRLAVAGVFGLAAASGESDSVVRFANGDRLTGALESLTTERLVWRSPILQGATTLRLDKVLDLTLPSEVPDFEAGHEATLALTNGDTVRGQLASVTDDVIQLDTWFAGRLEFRRVMVKSLEISERPELLYRGPTGLAEWTQSDDPEAWTFQSGSLRSHGRGGIAREIEQLPEECSIAFEVAWRGSLRLNMIFFSNDITTDKPEHGYELVLNPRMVQMQKRGIQQNWLGHTSEAGELRQNERAKIEVRASLKTGMIAFFVDDRIIDVWTDADVGAEGLGKGIHFVADDGSPMRVSGIEVSSWDGMLNEMPEPRNRIGGVRGGGQFNGFPIQGAEPGPEADTAEEGRMLLRNGDSLKGEVISITDGVIKVETDFGEVSLPVGRLRNITLKPMDLEEPKRNNGDVRAWFADGSSMVFRLDEVKNDTLSGFSQTFGIAEFKTNAFSRLEFNIYSLEMQEIRGDEPW